jgi:hypothetical protein
MNRRTALKFSMLLGGLAAPGRLWAQSRTRKASNSKKPSRFEDDGGDIEIGGAGGGRDREPADGVIENSTDDFTQEPGFQWKNYDISAYCKTVIRAASKRSKPPEPQKALIDWTFRRTNSDVWHGEKRAVLCAGKARLRAYNSPEVLKQVDEVVERFTNAVEDVVAIRVQFVAAVDTRWRYTVYSHLTPVGSGPQGQQIWTMNLDDAALVLSNMSVQQGFRKIFDQSLNMINGQTLTISRTDKRGYAGGMQREGAAGLGFQPKPENLEEGITLRVSPLLTFDGDAVDAAIDLTVNTVRSFHRTKVLAPREIGPTEMAIDVPEVSMTHLDQTVKNWPLGQTIVISAGIHPGILEKKGGLFGLPIPGTYPTGTEVLVFLDVELGSRARNVAPPRSVDRDGPVIEESPSITEEIDGGEEPAPRKRTRRESDF